MLVAIAVMMLAGGASQAVGAESLQLEWDVNPEPDLAGYRIYFRTAYESYGQGIDTGLATTATMSNLVPGMTYFFAVTAYNAAGLESPNSGEITFTPTPNPVAAAITSMERLPDGSFRFVLSSAPSAAGMLAIYVSSDLKTWKLLANLINPTGTLVVTDPEAASSNQRFYRVQAD